MRPAPDTSQPWSTLMLSISMTAPSVTTLAATMAKYSLTRPVSTWSKHVVPCTVSAEAPVKNGADALPAQRAWGGNDLVLFNVLRRITLGINNGMVYEIHVLGNYDCQSSANFQRQNKSPSYSLPASSFLARFRNRWVSFQWDRTQNRYDWEDG